MKHINKGRRQELKNLEFLKRLDKYGLKGKEGNFHAFRSHGSPCSCSMCRDKKYRDTDRKKEKKQLIVFTQSFNEIRWA